MVKLVRNEETQSGGRTWIWQDKWGENKSFYTWDGVAGWYFLVSVSFCALFIHLSWQTWNELLIIQCFPLCGCHIDPTKSIFVIRLFHFILPLFRTFHFKFEFNFSLQMIELGLRREQNTSNLLIIIQIGLWLFFSYKILLKPYLNYLILHRLWFTHRFIWFHWISIKQTLCYNCCQNED